MEVRIVESPEIYLAGMSFYGDPFAVSADWTEENEIGRLWNRFMAFLQAHRAGLPGLVEAYQYEVHIEVDQTPQTGVREVFVGLELERLQPLPLALSIKILPAGTYAVFTLAGEEILSDWGQKIYLEWMPGSGWEGAGAFGFERYDERFKGVARIAESVVDVWVPVRPAG